MPLLVCDCSCQERLRARSLDLRKIFMVVLLEPSIEGSNNGPCYFLHPSEVYNTCCDNRIAEVSLHTVRTYFALDGKSV